MWTDSLSLSSPTQAQLRALPRRRVATGTPLFHAGDHAQAFVIVLDGKIEVRLTSSSGREILLYSVEAGQSCVQTTLGLLGDESYTGEAVTVSESELVLVPKAMFLQMVDQDAGFRGFVLRAFGQRMADLTRVLESIAFERVEVRLAAALLELAENDVVHATQAELAARIGSAREVITRRLDAFQRAGWVHTDRGTVTILDRAALSDAANVT